MNLSIFNLNLAVVIGINDYQNEIPTLGTAKQDAQAIAVPNSVFIKSDHLFYFALTKCDRPTI
jgi:hypothetical protein